MVTVVGIVEGGDVVGGTEVVRGKEAVVGGGGGGGAGWRGTQVRPSMAM